jgi:metal-responsive CopG/Arc/MetJ family transcriptional regulator
LGKPRKAKISVLLNDEELERLERYCTQRGYKKSTLIARLIRDHLDAEHFRVQGEFPLIQPSPESAG